MSYFFHFLFLLCVCRTLYPAPRHIGILLTYFHMDKNTKYYLSGISGFSPVTTHTSPVVCFARCSHSTFARSGVHPIFSSSSFLLFRLCFSLSFLFFYSCIPLILPARRDSPCETFIIVCITPNKSWEL